MSPKFLYGYTFTDIDHLSTFCYRCGHCILYDGPGTTSRVVSFRRLIPSGTEEFINFFDMNYPVPQNSAFGIVGDAAPSPFYDDEAYILRIGLQGYEVSEEDRDPRRTHFCN